MTCPRKMHGLVTKNRKGEFFFFFFFWDNLIWEKSEVSIESHDIIMSAHEIIWWLSLSDRGLNFQWILWNQWILPFPRFSGRSVPWARGHWISTDNFFFFINQSHARAVTPYLRLILALNFLYYMYSGIVLLYYYCLSPRRALVFIFGKLGVPAKISVVLKILSWDPFQSGVSRGKCLYYSFVDRSYSWDPDTNLLLPLDNSSANQWSHNLLCRENPIWKPPWYNGWRHTARVSHLYRFIPIFDFIDSMSCSTDFRGLKSRECLNFQRPQVLFCFRRDLKILPVSSA